MPTPWWYTETAILSPGNGDPIARSAYGTGASPAGHPAAGEDLLAILRTDLVGELQAISQYEAHARTATDPRIRAALLHIAQDEKQHVAELMQLIMAHDRAQALTFTRPSHV